MNRCCVIIKEFKVTQSIIHLFSYIFATERTDSSSFASPGRQLTYQNRNSSPSPPNPVAHFSPAESLQSRNATVARFSPSSSSSPQDWPASSSSGSSSQNIAAGPKRTLFGNTLNTKRPRTKSLKE